MRCGGPALGDRPRCRAWPAWAQKSGWGVAGLAGCAEQAGERRDCLDQQRVDAGLLVGCVPGAELGDRAAVPGLGGELAYPGCDGGSRDGAAFAAACGGAAVALRVTSGGGPLLPAGRAGGTGAGAGHWSLTSATAARAAASSAMVFRAA